MAGMLNALELNEETGAIVIGRGATGCFQVDIEADEILHPDVDVAVFAIGRQRSQNYANLTQENITPLKNEPVVVIVPAETGAVQQEPCILLKIGDGTTPFNDLPFVAGRAADVYNWAKAATKPSYTASEIEGLDDYISGQIEDTDTQYQIVVDGSNDHLLKLQSRPKGGGSWTDVTTITLPDDSYNDTEVRGLISANTTAIEVLNGTGAGSVSKQVADAVAQIVSDAPEAYDTLKEISDWITSHASSAAEMNSNIQSLQTAMGGKVDKVEGKQLSTEDYTTTEKSKLAGIAEGAQVNVIEAVQVNGSPVSPSGKTVNISVPTGALASKSEVAESDLAAALASKINAKADDSALAAIAKTGNVSDLILSPGDVIILNGGTATTVI